MNDQRITPDPQNCTQSVPAQVRVPLTNLRRSAGGPRDRQLLLGDIVTILTENDEWSYVQSSKDDYCGYIRSADLTAPTIATHRVHVPATQCYERADMKSPDLFALSHNSKLTVTNTTGLFAKTDLGFVPIQHLREISVHESDPAIVAELYLGTPYLWGGNSRVGIDCSGLVQAACLACGIPCPGDSDLQETAVGTLLPVGTRPARNDLIFWKGHVALVWDTDTLIHANAHTMAVNFEPCVAAIDRIASQGGGAVMAHKRL